MTPTVTRTRPGALPLWAAACFLASGAAGLLYEIVWSKQLAYLLGSSLHAVAAVVASFLGGLAIGARWLGVPLARRGDGARTYAWLEIGVAVLGLALLPLLRASDPLVGQLYRALGGEGTGFAAARLGLVVLFLLPPAALMGATLPVLVAHVERDLVGAALARLYALNTLGAVAGSLAAGFLLLPNLGLTATTFVAAGLNLLVAAIAWTRGGAAQRATSADAAPTAEPVLDARTRTVVAWLFALSGFGALAFQIAWVRLFSLVFGSSVYSFSAVLGVYLLGIALGAALVGPRLARVGTLTGFATLQLALAALGALAVQAFPGLPQRTLELVTGAGGDWRGLLVAEAGTVAFLIGLPCVLLGAIFPVAVRLLQSRDGGHAAGTAYAVNTAGTIAGSLAAGFVLVPTWGVQGTHLGAVALAGGIGLAALALAWARGERRGMAPVVAVALALAAGLFGAIAPPWDPTVMSAGVYRPFMAAQMRAASGGSPDGVRQSVAGNRVLYHREGINTSVLLGTDAAGSDLWLRVGGKVDASVNDMETQVMLGLLPGALASPGARALVIGHGSGVTTASVLASGVGSLEVVELEPGVVEASRWFHPEGQDPLADPRTTLIIGDARTHLLHSAGRYGLIVSEPSNPWIAGVNNLFTVDFYRRVRARLEPDGVFCQWLQMYELSPSTFGTLMRSYLEVFPEGHVFLIRRNHDLLLVACPPGRGFDLERLRTPAVARELVRARVSGPEVLPAYWLGPLAALRASVGTGPLNRDDRPVVEYRAPQDLVAVGSSPASVSTEVLSSLPFVGPRPAGELFAAWTPGAWYESRVRALAQSGDTARAARVLEAARAEGAGAAAEAVYAQAVRRARSVALYDLAVAHMQRGERPQARARFEEAVVADPTNHQAWVVLADRRRYDGDVEGARRAIAEAGRSSDPQIRCDAVTLAGLMAIQSGDAPAALAAFAEARAIQPTSAKPYLYEAQVRARSGDTSGAVEVLRRGLAASPGSGELSQALQQLGASL